MSSYPPPVQPSGYAPAPQGGMRYLLWAVSFFIPVVGFVMGIIYMQRPDPDSQRFARTSLILAIAFIVVMCMCFACYFVAMMLLGFAPLFFLPFIMEPTSWLALVPLA
jgi:hypothetical protein